MVATRSRGKATGDAATTNAPSTTSILNAPPKRAPKRKAEEAPAAEPAALFTAAKKPTKRTKTAEPAPKKPADKPATKPATRTTRRAAKPVEETQAEDTEAPEPAKRATRGRKAAVLPPSKATAPAPTKATTTAPKKAAAPAPKKAAAPAPKKAAAPAPKKAAAPAPKKSAQKPATRTTRRAAKPVEETQAEDTEAPEPAKRATRGRKAAEPAPPVQDEEALQAILNQEALEELPIDYPTTPAHIAEAHGNQKAFKELAAEYPSTPNEFVDAHENQQAFEQMAGYPKTPSHITAPVSSREALRELPIDYPTTPAHIMAPVPSREALRELPVDYPTTPAHIMAPVSSREALRELPIDYPTTPAHIMAPGLDQLPGYPNTPAPKDAASSPAQAHGTPEAPPSDSATEEFVSALEVTEADLMEVDGEEYTIKTTPPPKVNFSIDGSLSLAPTLAPPKSAARASPTKSALRSPLKNGTKTPKKQVTWPEDFETEEDDTFDLAMLLHGMRFLVDVTSKGEDQSLFYVTSLEDFGAQVVREWTENTELTHVIFKDGSQDTIDKVRASNGAVKCINTGWLMEVEATKKRVDESKFAIDLDTVSVCTPVSRAPRRRDFFTPAKTPTRFLNNIESSSAAKSIEDLPATPTSSDFDRSVDTIEDKENNGSNWEDSTFFKKFSLSAPARKPWRKAQALSAAAKTPTKESLLREAPIKSSMFSERPIKSAMFSQPAVKSSLFGQTAAKESLFDQPPIKGPLFATAPKLGENAAKDSLFSQGPIKCPLFAPTPKNGQSQPPIKGPLFAVNPKLNFSKMSPNKNGSLFGQSPPKPASVDFAPAAADTWFDQHAKKSTLLGQGPVKSSTMSVQRPGRLSALLNKGVPSTPTASRVAPATNFLSTHKKRTASETFGGSVTATPAKKFRPLF
ncbi:uncharacterized protein CC84DRAFT_1257977 [Paraphaeosphaeria sporulosa]|uniref:BRCT domain-containing protein n=1 Tax=Paraphaeosphaeria sporulosa TaxID=1460663 RepID=A0A177CGJ4_9PLEO|nr:uncharacterized protein CC84DRAFT_1257977 [Paraphaeosphaeria sporulosa]OAG06703.1 hypothetical protein CC84DRAFT_1257977 [Paraphaeosphaeria sporulosa]